MIMIIIIIIVIVIVIVIIYRSTSPLAARAPEERSPRTPRSLGSGCSCELIPISGKDKGGPSKGGFLNNRLFVYTDIYIYIYIYVFNEINGMSIEMIYYSGQ